MYVAEDETQPDVWLLFAAIVGHCSHSGVGAQYCGTLAASRKSAIIEASVKRQKSLEITPATELAWPRKKPGAR